MKRNNKKMRVKLNRWHRWLGIFTALFVLLLSISGWLLNHTERLRLDENHVSSNWLLDWYGIKPQQSPVTHAAGQHWVTNVDGQLYFDQQLIAENAGNLVGAVAMSDFLVVAADHTLYLLLSDGRLVEKLSGAEGVPSGMQKIGLGPEGRLIVSAAHDVYTADLDTLKWQHSEPQQVDWSKPVEPPASHLDAVLEQYRGSGLPYERVLLDLHSGRILGSGGVWLVDIVALLFIGLAVTGCIMWWRGY